ncbi:GtrA family protein [Cryobacterium sp. TMT1-19]|uniref:GtrA family protein n=1 Tax=Cryobacterium sp. TMT1-19 TaxID=1259231 RepID=UPI00106C5A13|nr:GtrA family protein [Cryobacterium sp. TMT1-19]TFD40149.1 GtrA family protein [Cryobacterium sp. TMT1-19]
MPSTQRRSARLLAFVHQLGKFGAVGLVGFVVDFTVFNLLRTTVFDPAVVESGPIYAKVVSTTLAIIVNWIGNRFWTFGANRQSRTLREAAEFFAVSLVGMAIGLACLWVSRYGLGYTSLLADNISSNVVGLGLGSTFRFVLYRHWVFSPRRAATADSKRALAA